MSTLYLSSALAAKARGIKSNRILLEGGSICFEAVILE